MELSVGLTPNKSLVELFRLHGKSRKLCRGELVASRASDTPCLYQVKSGCLFVTLEDVHGHKAITTHCLVPGDFFGEAGLFQPSVKSVPTYKARAETIVVWLTHDMVRQAAAESPQLQNDLSQYLSHSLSVTTDKLMQLAFDDLEDRTYKCLVDLTRLPDALTHPEGMQISVSRIEIASMTGVSRESAGRALSSLRARNLIRPAGRSIVVLNARYGQVLNNPQRAKTLCA